MKLKSLLLASAAAMFAVSAQAADLPSDEYEAVPVPAPVATPDHSGVSYCDAMGVGFFVIPGSETCLKLGGRIEAGVLHARSGGANATWAGIRARMDIDTHTESDLGAIGSKFRVGLNTGFGSNAADTDVGVELAYITVGPAYVGFKETLFNTKFGYGDLFDADNYLGGLNTLTAGVMVENIGGGFYVGGGVETSQRGQWLAGYNTSGDVDFVARAGLAGQNWGGTDLSFIYSKALDTWGVKSTTDWAVLDTTGLRFTGAYADISGLDAIYVGAGAQHAFTDQISAFAGAGYVHASAAAGTSIGGVVLPVSVSGNAWLANAGVTYAPIQNFDVTGEVGYAKDGTADAWLGQLKFVRSW